MTQYSVDWSARLSSSSGSVPVGTCLVMSSDGTHFAGTTANRATYGRCVGIASTAGDASNPTVIMIETGIVPATVTGLAAGTVSWVRVSSTGTIERVTPGVGDDIIGKAHADGSVQFQPGTWDSTNYAGGGGGGGATLPINVADPASVTGTLAVANGGTGITSLGAGVATFWGTPSSANLLAAITDETGTGSAVFGTAPLFKTTINLNNPGNTFKYVVTPAAIAADRTLTLPLLAGNDTAVTEAFTQTLTNKTIAGASNTITVRLASDVSGTLPIANGGTGHAGAASAMGALAIDWTLSNVFTKTLSAGGNTITFSNAASGMSIVVRLTSNGGGSTVTWPTVRWAGGTPPTQTSTGTDVYTFVHDGSNIYGSYVQVFS